MVWHIIRARILLIVNIIPTDGIRMFFTIFCSGIINLLFDGLAYNTSGHFAHCSYFSSPRLRNSQNICTYYVLNHRIRCIYSVALYNIVILNLC